MSSPMLMPKVQSFFLSRLYFVRFMNRSSVAVLTWILLSTPGSENIVAWEDVDGRKDDHVAE